MKQKIMNSIRDYLYNNALIEDKNITEKTKILGYVNNDDQNTIFLSSLDYVEFIIYMETKYNVIVDYNADIDSVEKIINYILEHANDEKYKLAR